MIESVTSERFFVMDATKVNGGILRQKMFVSTSS